MTTLEYIPRFLTGREFFHNVSLDLKNAHVKASDRPAITPCNGKMMIIIRPNDANATGQIL